VRIIQINFILVLLGEPGMEELVVLVQVATMVEYHMAIFLNRWIWAAVGVITYSIRHQPTVELVGVASN